MSQFGMKINTDRFSELSQGNSEAIEVIHMLYEAEHPLTVDGCMATLLELNLKGELVFPAYEVCGKDINKFIGILCGNDKQKNDLQEKVIRKSARKS